MGSKEHELTRKYEEKPRTTYPRRDRRPATLIDKDRALYSREFLRLSEVTQVISPTASIQEHNRLSHSLKVAHMGRAIFRALRREMNLPPYLGWAVEFGGLAHDIGHPPFGHSGEKTLNKLSRDEGCEEGFEGNAQSFRIITSLSDKSPDFKGLNPTRASLRALLKYPWVFDGEGKYGVYQSDRMYFDWVVGEEPLASGRQARALAAEMMDLADDLTYAIHDLIEFTELGKIPLARLLGERDYREQQFQLIADGRHLVLKQLQAAHSLVTRMAVSDSMDNPIYLKLLESELIRFFLGYLEGPEKGFLTILNRQALDGLKHLHRHYVIEEKSLAIRQRYESLAVAEVFSFFIENIIKVKQPGGLVNPTEFQRFKNGELHIARLVCDAICKLSDTKLSRFHSELIRGGYKDSVQALLGSL